MGGPLKFVANHARIPPHPASVCADNPALPNQEVFHMMNEKPSKGCLHLEVSSH